VLYRVRNYSLLLNKDNGNNHFQAAKIGPIKDGGVPFSFIALITEEMINAVSTAAATRKPQGEAYIQLNMAWDIYMLQGETPETVMSRETLDISQFCELGFYEWIMFREEPDHAQFPADNPILGRYLGPAIDVRPAMTAKILKLNGEVINQSMYCALTDVEIRGKTIRKGEKVILWHASANRDEEVYTTPDHFQIGREASSIPISFGHGIHRCVGSRLAEMQLCVLWEEILKRFSEIRVVGVPVRVPSTFVRGYRSMQVLIPSRL
jgi:hypothetical protein